MPKDKGNKIRIDVVYRLLKVLEISSSRREWLKTQNWQVKHFKDRREENIVGMHNYLPSFWYRET